MSLAQVGAALGVGEDAAQKRVSRALVRLRKLLRTPGTALSAQGIAAALAALPALTAPASCLPLLGPAGPVASLAAGLLADTTLRALAWLKAQSAAAIIAGTAALAGTGALIVPFMAPPAQAQLTFPVLEPGPQEQEMSEEEFLNLGMQMVVRMQEKGIDPQAVLNDIMTQSEARTYDGATFEQWLIDQELTDADTLGRVRRGAQGIALIELRRQLVTTDEEWSIIRTKIEALVTALADAGQLGRISRGAGLPLGLGPSPAISHALNDLRAIIRDQGATAGKVRDKLDAYRTLRSDAERRLTRCRQDLQSVLTLRQEAILLRVGLLE